MCSACLAKMQVELKAMNGMDKSVPVKATSHSAIFVRACMRSKIPMTFFPLKTARSARHGSYSIEFCSFHSAHAWKSLSENQPLELNQRLSPLSSTFITL